MRTLGLAMMLFSIACIAAYPSDLPATRRHVVTVLILAAIGGLGFALGMGYLW